MARGAIKEHSKGVTLSVRLQPAARKSEIVGLRELDDTSSVLLVRVTAPPEKGKANAALLKLLSKHFAIPRKDLSLLLGEVDRRKVILITGDKDRVTQALSEMFERLDWV